MTLRRRFLTRILYWFSSVSQKELIAIVYVPGGLHGETQKSPRSTERPLRSRDESSRSQIQRKIILEAVSPIFGEKGYSGAAIAEIARCAKVAEASIYQYLKSKEDLLLSVPGKWFDGLTDRLIRGFSGKLRPPERLSYLLRRWQLDFRTEEDKTRILILELYRNPAFYDSQAYKGTHRFRNLIRSIVEEGRETGHFRSEFKTDCYLHLIQGTFEHESLARMMPAKRETTVANTEQMTHLLIRAIEAR